MSVDPYRGHRFPREIISYAVWFYYRFAVSFRDVEDAMASRGVLVSSESVRRWCEKFGHLYAAGVRRRRARTGDKWHLDEVFLNINGERHYLPKQTIPNLERGHAGVCSCVSVAAS